MTEDPLTRPSRAWRTALVLASASLALTACGGNSSDDSSSSSSSSSAPSSSSASKGDGTLTIGTLLPQTGDLAFLGPPEFAGVATAITDINAAFYETLMGVSARPLSPTLSFNVAVKASQPIRTPCPIFWRHPLRWLAWNPFLEDGVLITKVEVEDVQLRVDGEEVG